MKSFRTGLLLSLLAFAIVLQPSCSNKAEDKSPATASDDILITSEFELADLIALENPAFTEATEEQDMAVGGDPNLQNRGPCAKIHYRMNIRQADSLQHPHHLGLVFRKMDLDTAQLRQIRGYMREYCHCTSDYISRIRNIHREIIARGNNKRQELLIAYRNGRIDRTQLQNRLRLLNKNIRQALIDAPGKAEGIKAVKRCRHELHTNIASVLDQQQLQMWRRWVASHR